MVEHVQQAIAEHAKTEMEATYLQYKIGGQLLAMVLNKYDIAMAVSDFQSL